MTEDEAEFDPSTPENGAEEDPSFLHIAQQERTFSEEDMARIQKNKPKEVRVTIHSPEGEGHPISSTDEGRVVYSEPERDNTCVDV